MASNDIETVIRYDGPALTGHEIDVQELAPALLALAEMVQLANRKFNGEATTMRVSVKADVEQRCFQLHIHIFQTLLQHAQHLFGTAEYKTAKEIAQDLDLIFPEGVGGGIFLLWRWLANRRKESPPGTSFTTEQHGGNTTIVSGDGNNITVRSEVYLLASDPAVTELGRRVLRPLEQPGYETLSFHQKDVAAAVVEVSQEEASYFIEAPSLMPPSEAEAAADDDEHNEIHVTVFVKTQRNEGRAQWELKWGGRSEMVSIDDTPWLDDFQNGRVPHDLPLYLDVKIDVITSRTNPDAPARFHLTKVIGVVPSGQGKQVGLFNGDHTPGSA
jgi:hypothetical protein